MVKVFNIGQVYLRSLTCLAYLMMTRSPVKPLGALFKPRVLLYSSGDFSNSVVTGLRFGDGRALQPTLDWILQVASSNGGTLTPHTLC